MPESSAAPTPTTDTSDMLAVHRVFREALKVGPQLVGTASPGDTARSEVVGAYYDNVLRFLEVHHSGEDELVTPLLSERCTPAEMAVVTRVAAQHEEVAARLPRADTALRAWRASAGAQSGSELVQTLGALGDSLLPHLDEEEEKVLPLAAAYLSAEEWGALPGHGLSSFTGDNVWLVLGLIREQMTEQQRQMMLEHMPPPVADAWRSTGEAEFRACIGEVRAPL
jgi:hemerythrin-like domain-containing protein